jgi:anti-anti-sigma factor
MKTKLEISVKEIDNIVVFNIKGGLTFYSKDLVYEHYNKFLDQGKTRFVFNLEELEYIDSSGMGVILIGATKLKGEKIRIVGNKRISAIFDMLKADRFLDMYANEDAAFKSFN